MRKLTVVRGKAFPLCLRSIKVYIEDPYNGTVEIQGVKCRELGGVKNGKTESFEIGAEAAKVFIGGDLAAPCQIPEGYEDVKIEGKIRSVSGVGYIFMAEGQENAEFSSWEISPELKAKAARNAAVTRIVLVLAVCAAVGVIVFSFVRKLSPKTFTVGEMSMTLTSEFELRKTEENGHELFCDRYSIYVDEFGFLDISTAAIIDARGFAEMLLSEEPDMQNVEIKEKDGLVYIEFEEQNELYKNTNYYIMFFYKGNNSFWTMQFASDIPDAWGENAFKYASSVTFGN